MQNQFYLLIIVFVALIIIILFFNIIISIVENIYGFLFNKPLYVHIYFKIKKLSPDDESLINSKFSFYNALSQKEKKIF